MPDRNSSTAELEQAVEEFYRDFPYPPAADFALDFACEFESECARAFVKAPSLELYEGIASAAALLYLAEAPAVARDILISGEAEFRRETHTDPIAHARYRDKLLAILKHKDQDHESQLRSFKHLLETVFEPLIEALPLHTCRTPNYTPPDSPTIPIHAALPDPSAVVNAMAAPFLSVADAYALYQHDQMGIRVGAIIAENIRKKRIPIQDTPLLDIFDVQVAAAPAEPEEVPPEPAIDENNWYAHCLLLAMTRFGKTNAICWRVMQLLPQIARGEASLILMEPKGILIDDLLHLADVWKMRDRVVVIDPSDLSIGINLFERAGSINETVARVTRVMGTLTTEMTSIQRDALTFAVHALYASSDEPNLRGLMEILRRGKAGIQTDRLDEETRDFFEYDFKEADGRFIIARLRSLIANPVFRSIFAAERTTFDMFKEIQAGKLILIKATGEGLAGEHQTYGRFWIEQVNKCMWPRLAIKNPSERTPTTFVVDEAADYISDDPRISQLLRVAAEAKVGMIFALQSLADITDNSVKHALLTNTAIKFVARTTADIHAIGGSMGDREELPKLLQKTPRYHFYMFNPDLTTAVLTKFPLVDLKRMQQMSREEHSALLNINRRRYAHTQQQPTPGRSEQIAALSPIAAILEARRMLEDALRGTVMALSLPECTPDMTMLEMIRALQTNGLIDAKTTDWLHKLRRFANDAAHNMDASELTKERAVEFREGVDYVIAALANIRQPPPPPSSNRTRPNDEPTEDDPYG